MPTARSCEICKQPIDEDRLEAIPETRLCGEHARQVRRFGGEFIVTATQEKTSKATSFKHNFGGVATEQTRNHEAIAKLLDEYQRQQQP